MPFGAEWTDDGEVRFRLFAPGAEQVGLALDDAAEPLTMSAKPDGWHELSTSSAAVGSRYCFVLPDGTRVPDPASRYQPEDVSGPSEVTDPNAFCWTDKAWQGIPWTEAILYELHIGTFTPEGTFRAAAERLGHLSELGINAIELMCLSDFAGKRNWGYDGVLLYAPDSAYGTPDELKAFLDAAHACGIMVLLDVVYNHFGPEGNLISNYFSQICSDLHETPWGRGLNFDGPLCAEVRDFIIHNALYWIEEFHVDGLRIDASHAMIDDSPKHILDELHDRIEALPLSRPVHLILESEQNIEARLTRDDNGAAAAYTAQWNHDITHLLGAVFSNLCEAGREEETGKLGKALAEGFVLAAQMASGSPCCTVPPTSFIAFIQTHDLVGNRIFGDRIFAAASANAIRAIASIYLLLPQIPMLFMGEEWGASTPFPFFCDYHGQLAAAVKKGRFAQLTKLDPAPSEDEMKRAPDPQAESTWRSAQLDWRELDQPSHATWFDWYKRILAVRRQAVVPLLKEPNLSCGVSEIVGPGALTIRWTMASGATLHLAANLCKQPSSGFPPARGRVIWQEGVPGTHDGEFEPWSVRWTIEDPSPDADDRKP